ncbi:hypothetical protein DFH28DRAFT_1119188 [Melampsora americana]|nr:hypothetical protein DFH28DRAFT_1119188 [Melampsora americana]
MDDPFNPAAASTVTARPVVLDPVVTTTHGIYLSGNFEIEKKISSAFNRKSDAATYTVSIVCGGIHRKKIEIYEIQARGFNNSQFQLECDRVYLMRGSFFPKNQLDTSSDLFLFEGNDHPFVATTKAYNGSMINCVGITGIGVVLSIDILLRSRVRKSTGSSCLEDNVTMAATVLHSQFNPIVMKPTQAKVEYHIEGHCSGAGVRPKLQLGREYLFHGFIKDFNEKRLCWVVIVNRVSATTGNSEYIVTPADITQSHSANHRAVSEDQVTKAAASADESDEYNNPSHLN